MRTRRLDGAHQVTKRWYGDKPSVCYHPCFVMARLPYSNDRAVRLHLINIAAFHPYLSCGRLLNDYRLLLHHDRDLGDNRLLHHYGFGAARTHIRIHDRSADKSANEPAPESPAAASPSAMVIVVAMVVMVARRRQAWTAKSIATRATKARSSVRTGKRAYSNCRDRKHYHCFFHVSLLFCVAFCVHIWLGKKVRDF